MKRGVLQGILLMISITCMSQVILMQWHRDQENEQLQVINQMLQEEKIGKIEPIGQKESVEQKEPQILSEYLRLYEMNQDLIGWLKIEGTRIDYPVMQTPEDENYYIDKGFDREKNSNGSLILDTSCQMGNAYQTPSTNLIIHGHHMRSGEMFGDLEKYRDVSYAKAHERIQLDTLYEKREYQVIAVFLSQVYNKSDVCFKYYQFVEADTPEAFDTFYDNIKNLALFDTGVSASFGDEFLTLSTCSYHTEDGRLVVVAKRVI